MARDHADAYRRRNERAKAMGYRSYADQRRQRQAGTPRPTDKTARPDLRSIINLPDGRRLVTPRGGQGDQVALSQLRQPGTFTARATVKDADGNPVEVELFTKGRWRNSELRSLIKLHGLKGAIAYLINNGMGVGGNGTGGSLGMAEVVEAADVLDVELDVR